MEAVRGPGPAGGDGAPLARRAARIHHTPRNVGLSRAAAVGPRPGGGRGACLTAPGGAASLSASPSRDPVPKGTPMPRRAYLLTAAVCLFLGGCGGPRTNYKYRIAVIPKGLTH